MPEPYRRWNRAHGAPFGRRVPRGELSRRLLPSGLRQRLAGPFAFQPNNSTRTFEYPWAYHATPLEPGQRVLEVGGGFSGFQFALDRQGCRVVNVDPGIGEDGSWKDHLSIAAMNRLFGTSVEWRRATVPSAGLEPGSFDTAFSISVLEHLDDTAIAETVAAVFACLRPGGSFVLTVDLFLDVAPFTSSTANVHGRNVDVRALAGAAPFRLVQGDRRELLGYPEFDLARIRTRLEDYFVGDYPALAQCLVLEKPADPRSPVPYTLAAR
jgi:SAM-dependent methyltransferase